MKNRIQSLVPGLVAIGLNLALTVNLQAGSTVNFGNNNSNKVVNGHTSAPITANDNVNAALYWAPIGSSSFTQLGSTVTVGNPAAGIFVGGTVRTGPATAGGNSAKFRVRAWSGGAATYEVALAQSGVLIGQSAVFTNLTGNSAGVPPTPPESLLAGGLTGFGITSNTPSVQPPTITCATNKTVACDSAWSFDPPTATDGCTGLSLTAAALTTTTNGLCPQTATRTWSVTNSCDTNFVQCSQTVTVICPSCPMLIVSKSCPPFPVPPGGTLAWTGTVTNASEIAVTNVVVVNDHPVPDTVVFGPVTLLPGAGAAFGGSYNVAACSCGQHQDTLSASGVSLTGITFTGSATASCAGTNYVTPGDMNGDGIVDQNELNAVLANYWPHSPWLYMSNATPQADGRFQFELTNAGAWNFTVLVSTNATDWSSLPAPAFPVYQFIDPEGTNAPQRLYRLRWP